MTDSLWQGESGRLERQLAGASCPSVELCPHELIAQLPDSAEEELVRIPLDVEGAPLVEGECSLCCAQRSAQGVAPEYVSDLHVDEVGYVDADSGVFHPLRDALSRRRIQQQLDRGRGIENQQRCLPLSLAGILVVGARVAAGVPLRAEHVGRRWFEGQLGLPADSGEQVPPARPLQRPLDRPHHVL